MMLQEKNELTNESAVMTKSFFTSESVADGHPDKVADQVSDSILDACLTEDPYSKVALETLITNGLLVLAGEITSTAKLDYEKIAKDTIRAIGYTDKAFGFDVNTCYTLLKITEQSPDIAIGVQEEGAGDQGIMFGYACDETDVLMPLPIMLAHNLVRGLKQARVAKTYPYIRPDGKSQVTVEYDEKGNPIRVDAIVVSVQHDDGVSLEQVHKDMMAMTHTIIPAHLMDKHTKFFINPTGRFVIGGPQADTGLTGRKIIVDSYGGYARHGGGAFSGKDATKVDRSAAYGARYIAKNIVGAKLAKKCEIQLSYAIGVKDPLSIRIDTKGTGLMDEESLIKLVKDYFPLRPFDIIEHLDLRAPRYKKTAFGGHFGRNEEEFSWEKLNPSFVSRFN